MNLRPRREGDLLALADLWVATWQEAMPAIDFESRRAWFREHLQTIETAGAITTCAADVDDRVFGFVTLDATAGYLDQIAVAPAAKGSGVARTLLSDAKRQSPRGLLLDVNQDNARAVRFYEQAGFSATAEGINAASGLKTWRMQWRPA